MTDNTEHTLLNFQKSRPANPVQRQKAKEVMEEYPYELVIDHVGFANSCMYEILKKCTPEIKRFNVRYIGHPMYHLPYSGYYTYQDIMFYYSDEYKSGKCYMFFKTYNDMEKMNQLFAQLNSFIPKSIPIYAYNGMSNTWYQEKLITQSDRENYVGNQEIIDEILNVINMYNKHSAFLKKIDESKSINILLYGPPGCGKTSLWKLIASLTERSVGIVNHHNIMSGKYVFSPDKKYNINTIVLEDFDRWIKLKPDMDIAQILNSLDGVDDNSSYLRFFTCNDPTLIEENKALLDRFYATYYIGIPTKEAICAKVNKILSFYETNDLDKVNYFIDLLVERKLGNIRKLVHYMIK